MKLVIFTFSYLGGQLAHFFIALLYDHTTERKLDVVCILHYAILKAIPKKNMVIVLEKNEIAF